MKKTLYLTILAMLIVLSGARATVTTQNINVAFTCTGGTGPFPFTFPISDPTALTVTEAGAILAPTSYTVRPVNNNYQNGGSVTLGTACASGTLVLQRMTPLTQASVFTDNMPLPFKTNERGLDKLTEIDQELKQQILAISSGPPGAAGGVPCIAPVGADPTASTDSTAAMVSAISSAPTGGTICPAPGTYLIATPPIIVSKPIGLLGSAGTAYLSSAAVTFTTPSATAYLLDFEAGSEGSWVQGLYFNSSASTPTAGGGIYLNPSLPLSDGTLPYTIRGNSFSNLYNAVVSTAGNGITLTENKVNGMVNDGFKLTGIGFFTARNHIYRCGNADIHINTSGWSSTDDDLWGSLHGIICDDCALTSIQGLTLDWMAGHGIVVNAADHLTIRLNELNAYQYPSMYGTNYGGYGIYIPSGASVDGLYIEGGAIRGCLMSGIYIGAGKNVFVDNVKFSANGHNNTGAWSGVDVAANVSLFHVRQPVCGAQGTDDLDIGNQAYCVNIAAGSSTGWEVLDPIIYGGPAPSGINGIEAVHFGGAVTGVYHLRLEAPGNFPNAALSRSIGGVIIAQGSIALGGTYSIDLAANLPAPYTSGYGATFSAKYVASLAYPGSDTAAEVKCMRTADTYACTIPIDTGRSGIGYISATDPTNPSTITFHNTSGSVAANYLVVMYDAEEGIL